MTQFLTKGLAAVVQTLDSAIHRIKIYPLDSAIGFRNTYPLDSDLSAGQRYPTFEQPEPGLKTGMGFKVLLVWKRVWKITF